MFSIEFKKIKGCFQNNLSTITDINIIVFWVVFFLIHIIENNALTTQKLSAFNMKAMIV